MKDLNKKICLLIIVPLELLTLTSFVQGQPKTKVTIIPSEMKIRPSLTTAVDVQIESVENLFAASVTLAFDSTFLRYTGIMKGPFLTSNNANSVFLGVVPHPPPPAAPNKVTVDQAICGGGTVSGSGILFSVLYKAIRVGSSPITIASNEFRNGLNNYIHVQIDSGKITVNNAPMAVQLLSPPNGFLIDTAFHVMLVWSKSSDSDTSDSIRYNVHLMSLFSDYRFSNLSDTMLPLTKGILKENTEFTWYVDATDGIDTAVSEQQFKFITPMVQNPYKISDVFKVEQNYPNPFNQGTTIRFSIPRATQVNVKVYDITGREVVRLMSDAVDAGYYIIAWNGRDSNGISVGSGIYFYAITAGSESKVKKMVLLK